MSYHYNPPLFPNPVKIRLSIRKIRLDMGGYDPDGQYFGVGVPGESLYQVDEWDGTVEADRLPYRIRAFDRGYVKDHARKLFPNATFTR